MTISVITENTTQQNGDAGTVISGVEDNQLRDDQALTNYGTTNPVEITKWAAGNHTHVIMRFDTSTLSGSDTVTSAILYLNQTLSTATYNIAVREILQTGWSVSLSNWTNYTTSTTWASGGCLGAGTDRVNTPVSSTSINSTLGYYALDVTAIVNANIGGSIELHIERADAGEDSTAKAINSSNGSDGVRPELHIVHSSASGTVTQADTTPEDGTIQSFTTSGMTGPITAATLSGFDILSLLSDTDPTTATTYTLDISAIGASQGAPRIGETSTLSITTATDGAVTTDVTIQPKTGWFVTTGTSIDTTANGFGATVQTDFGITLADGNLCYMSQADNEALTSAWIYTSDLLLIDEFSDFVIQQGGTATTVSTSEGGAFFPFGQTVVNKPIINATRSAGGLINISFAITLVTTGGDPVDTWAITGGADQAQYNISGSVAARTANRTTAGVEVFNVTATNTGGTSDNTQVITVTYSEPSEYIGSHGITISSIRIGL